MPALSASSPDRPRRRDARANREAILAAAAQAWSDGGFDVGLVEVARRACVGSATLYRHFGTREALVAEVYGARIAELGAQTRRAASGEDPWEALVRIVELLMEAGAGDRGLRQLIAVGFGATPTRVVESTAIAEHLRGAVARALDAGVLRAGVAPADLSLTLFAIGRVADVTEAVAPGQWRRTLRLVFDGLRHGEGALPGAAMTHAEWDEVIRRWMEREL
ncbi:MAG TPA: TetR/AcrR family transcriptional regulator, partial [Solirubrobacteraceae bacterium]|nr:TetR/AcrR family transcriptional regulator [Solirubrobacteraceae bacterium]